MEKNKLLAILALGACWILSRGARRPALPLDGVVTSGFGYRIHPVTHTRSFHGGIDIACRVGTPVKVPLAGQVLKVGENPSGGLQLMIAHREGLVTGYAHLSRVKVKKGQRVTAGQVVALSGNSGRSTGPHLHYVLTRWGKSLDPLQENL